MTYGQEAKVRKLVCYLLSLRDFVFVALLSYGIGKWMHNRQGEVFVQLPTSVAYIRDPINRDSCREPSMQPWNSYA